MQPTWFKERHTVFLSELGKPLPLGIGREVENVSDNRITLWPREFWASPSRQGEVHERECHERHHSDG